MIFKKAVLFSACLFLNLSLATTVRAEEIVIQATGNGAGSNNEVNVSSQATTTVAQENQANVNNNVNTDANTGNNNANSNSGDTTIDTGDINATTNVTNQNINTNSSNLNCGCDSSTLTTISGNGAGSNNNAYITNSSSTSIGQTNNARINNNLTINANTGYNSSLFNGGSATIVTGNIKAKTNVNNKNINNSNYDGPGSLLSSNSVVIVGNGANSTSNVAVSDENGFEIAVLNLAEILNNVEHNLNTGNNSTIGNLGDSVIITGNIESDITVNNENINSSSIEIDCDCSDPTNPPTPTTPTTPTTPGTSIVQGSNGSSSSSGGPAAGTSLPRTGATIPMSFMLTLVLLFMFLSGLYLRFHSSKAPPVMA